MVNQPIFFKVLLYLTLCNLLSSIGFAGSSNKWRLQFSGSAHSDGTIVIKIMPVGGTPMVARIDVKKDTSENKVAKTVVAALKAQLPKVAFHVERDDGEDVLIKKRRGAAHFDLEIISNSVAHVRIKPQHE